MKHQNNISSLSYSKSISTILFLFTILFFASCDKEKEEENEPVIYLPEINLQSPDTSHIIVGPGETFNLSLTVSINAQSTTTLNSLKIMRNYNNAGFETVLDSTISTYGYAFILNNYACYANDNEGIEEWKIIIEDNIGGSSSEIFTTEIVNLNPTLSFLSGEYEPGKVMIDADTTLPVGHNFVFGINAETGSMENLDRIIIKRIYENVSIITVLDSLIDVSSFTIDIATFSYPNPGQEEFEVSVWDKGNRSSTISFKITTVPAASGINIYEDKILGAQNSNLGIAFASTTGTIYNLADAKENAEKIDWMYFYEGSSMATLAAPNDESAALVYNHVQNGLQTWSVLNNTLFKETTFSSADFNAITSSVQLVAASTMPPPGPDQTMINNLSVGKVLAFKTVNGKYGLLRVDNILTGDSGSIEITVKVQ